MVFEWEVTVSVKSTNEKTNKKINLKKSPKKTKLTHKSNRNNRTKCHITSYINACYHIYLFQTLAFFTNRRKTEITNLTMHCLDDSVKNGIVEVASTVTQKEKKKTCLLTNNLGKMVDFLDNVTPESISTLFS